MRAFLAVVLLYTFGGCSNFKVNSTICNEINTEANTQNVPSECREYNKKKAYEAFDKKQQTKEQQIKDIIQLKKDKNE